jgi:glycosyltransferase involved in cell wall biosynthesis
MLRRAVRSILSQDYPGEVGCVVVFDQTEPADLSDLMSGAPDVRSLIVIRNTRTPGLAGARNSGVAEGAGELVAFCDDDDEWLPGKLSAQVEAMGDASVSVTGIEVAFGDRRVVRVPQGPVTLAALVAGRDASIHPSTLLVRKSAFSEIGWVDEQMPGSYGEDYEWLLRAAQQGPIAVAPEPLVRVYWGASLFADRWQTIAESIRYLVGKHPELLRSRANAARLFGRIAFAHAALGERGRAMRWAWRSFLKRPLEPRPYLALGVAAGLLRPAKVQERANRAGRGI